jgi:hypothetical protein
VNLSPLMALEAFKIPVVYEHTTQAQFILWQATYRFDAGQVDTVNAIEPGMACRLVTGIPDLKMAATQWRVQSARASYPQAWICSAEESHSYFSHILLPITRNIALSTWMRNNQAVPDQAEALRRWARSSISACYSSKSDFR